MTNNIRPRWLVVIGMMIIFMPAILYKTLPIEHKWVATFLGLLGVYVVFPISILIYATNKNQKVTYESSHLIKSKKATKDLIVRVLLSLLGLGSFIYLGIPLLKDSLYLIQNETIVFVGEITAIRYGPARWNLGNSQYITLSKYEDGETITLRPRFIYEKYKIGDSYLFTVLPNTNLVLKIDPKSSTVIQP